MKMGLFQMEVQKILEWRTIWFLLDVPTFLNQHQYFLTLRNAVNTGVIIDII